MAITDAQVAWLSAHRATVYFDAPRFGLEFRRWSDNLALAESDISLASLILEASIKCAHSGCPTCSEAKGGAK